jgi:hypothetical protein
MLFSSLHLFVDIVFPAGYTPILTLQRIDISVVFTFHQCPFWVVIMMVLLYYRGDLSAVGRLLIT